MPVQPKAILFDLDDCLLQDGPATTTAVDALFAELPWLDAADPQRYAQWSDAMRAHYPAFLRGEFDSDELSRRRMASLLNRPELSTSEALTLFDSFYLPYLSSIKCYPDALPLLEQLQTSGYRLGMVTNGPDRMQRDKLNNVGLEGYFDVVITAEQAGVGKPDARIFLQAVTHLQLTPDECWYIGDNLHNDARGAQSAGLTGIWLNREDETRWHLGDNQPANTATDGVWQLQQLSELTALL